jgi:hypothetical protein
VNTLHKGDDDDDDDKCSAAHGTHPTPFFSLSLSYTFEETGEASEPSKSNALSEIG